MRITTDTAALASCFDIIEKALPLRTTIPSIGNIFLEATEDNLSFSTTNLEMFINCSIPNKNDQSGKILLPPKIIDIVRYFPTEEITIDINWDNYRLDISGGSSHFNLYGADYHDYPVFTLPDHTENESFVFEQNIFKKNMRKVVFAASNEETRPAFNGVLFQFNNQHLTLTASDTYRLVVKEISDDSWTINNKKCLVPAKAMRELLRIIGDQNQNMSLSVTDDLLLFEFGQVQLSARLLDEKYPDVSGVIPKEYKSRITIDRKVLEDTISRASLLAEGKNQAVNLLLKEQKLEVKVSSQQGSMEDFVPVEHEGEDLELYINSRFILDFLKLVDDNSIIIDFHGDGGPLVFRLPEDDGYLYLVLPIKKMN
ncbi:MAG: hypothetical protein AVO34_01480 [Firmicutes bacterium ML8_F2]|jgi:DNA polymerase III subunit beta|nr:MAG: hypothetical protein AVO34_01480 [Firmicutes bacterium ML8_F2]